MNVARKNIILFLIFFALFFLEIKLVKLLNQPTFFSRFFHSKNIFVNGRGAVGPLYSNEKIQVALIGGSNSTKDWILFWMQNEKNHTIYADNFSKAELTLSEIEKLLYWMNDQKLHYNYLFLEIPWNEDNLNQKERIFIPKGEVLLGVKQWFDFDPVVRFVREVIIKKPQTDKENYELKSNREEIQFVDRPFLMSESDIEIFIYKLIKIISIGKKVSCNLIIAPTGMQYSPKHADTGLAPFWTLRAAAGGGYYSMSSIYALISQKRGLVSSLALENEIIFWDQLHSFSKISRRGLNFFRDQFHLTNDGQRLLAQEVYEITRTLPDCI
ncbi:MAG: hypothetical protein M9962_11815 [Oligoflexia bacterium]|nr:hypothetical protein [Oligoflexia bacterium]